MSAPGKKTKKGAADQFPHELPIQRSRYIPAPSHGRPTGIELPPGFDPVTKVAHQSD